ncbi:hypothetical protein UFOVP187_30 [uncultured Caudovirales phage]|uniref:Uncharacterized protein n=1 Tax=uncultured Caudovirales phage TaxID=2100421 RepID=A0A6J7WFF6_9CAUD|nr:hypothetical protein UFOVP187_30 [uncultured Caudovirales phage]
MNKEELECWFQGCIKYYNTITTGTKIPDLKEIIELKSSQPKETIYIIKIIKK